MRKRTLDLLVIVVAVVAMSVVEDATRAAGAAATVAVDSHAVVGEDNCLTCHYGIEDMHPWEPLSCTECHGGDGRAETKERAHVFPRQKLPNDERVLPLDFDPAYLRFKNPSNLRVLDQTCGQCHARVCADLERSLHGTTAGHLSDGMYEAGILEERGSRYGMFKIRGGENSVHEESLDLLYALPSFDRRKPRDEFATHYRDLPAKNCVRCHLWSPGVAVRGRLGLDGDYRSEGCAACHVTYADDGLAKGGDPTVDRFEPGHPIRHQMTTAVPTSTCTHCHYGDASIGLNFRGLAQLYPGQPAGPEVPGTTDFRLNQTFYINDPTVTPPDVHHERGMHCVDCHTSNDIMGDGNLFGQMPAAVEIECRDCHGTIDRTATLVTQRGTSLEHLTKEDGRVYLVSKVTGERHVVKQAAHVVNPRHPDYNRVAAKAMTDAHGRLECYACHGGWSPNFFGFHFDRNEQFTQLDMMTGERTPGRVTTQEKVFATFRGFYLGWNTDGMVAPYMVGFSSMGTVYDENGEVVLDQQMPVTHAGLSGMTLIHHQLHTTRPEARACADCHRNPTALGLGSPNANFRLGRDFMFLGSSRGLEVFAIDKKKISDSLPVSSLPLLGVRDLAIQVDPRQGHARYGYLALGGRGVQVVDLENPAFPSELGFLATEDPQAIAVAADRLYVADGAGGIKVVDVSDPGQPRLLSRVKSDDARDVALNWPHLYVADFQAGMRVLDVSNPERPVVASELDLNERDTDANQAERITLVHLPSRPDDGRGQGNRSLSRVLAVLACNAEGLRVVDVTEPREPSQVHGYEFVGGLGRGRAQSLVKGVAAGMHVDLGSPDGAIPTVENDYLYVTVVSSNGQLGRLSVVRITDPGNPELIDTARISPYAEEVALLNVFNAPFLQTYALVAGGNLFELIDVTKSDESMAVGQYGALRGARAIVVEAMPLDRLVDEAGRAWKDISHEGARYFSRQEIDKILRAEVPVAPRAQGPVTPVGDSDPTDPAPRREKGK